MGVRSSPYSVLVGKHGRPRSRWEDNIKIDLSRWDAGDHELD